MPKIAELVTVFSPLQAKLICEGVDAPGYAPIGAILMWPVAAAPDGWVGLDGSAISRTTYAALFALLGTNYGIGDGSTTFTLPDMRQRFPLGKAASGTGSTLGGTGGNIDHTHTSAAHTHTSAAHTHTVPAHYHGIGTGADLAITGGTNIMGSTGGSALNNGASQSYSIGNTIGIGGRIGLVTGGVDGNAAMTSGSTTPSDTGSTTPGVTGSNNPPFMSLNFIMKY